MTETAQSGLANARNAGLHPLCFVALVLDWPDRKKSGQLELLLGLL